MAEENYSLSGRVFQKLREDILSGKYKKNDELKEKTLGEEMGVSRTPVREALRQLELEGLVSMIPNKGAVVVGISQKDMKDIYEIRSLLEGLCARWACEKITKEQLSELDEINDLSDFKIARGHFDQLVELDNRFHEILYQASDSPVLEHVLKDYHKYVQKVRKVTLAMEERATTSNAEHKCIVDALKEEDPNRAEELARSHMNNTISNIDHIGWDNVLDSGSENI